MRTALIVTLVIALVMGLTMREGLAGSSSMWLGLAVPYAVLGGLSLHRLYVDGTLGAVMRPKGGDATIGILLGGALFGAAWGGKHLLFGAASPKIAWLLRLALQLDVVHASPKLFVGIAAIAALEELVWRGLVMRSLEDDLGARRAWPLAAVLYAAAHVPTVFSLSDPAAGKNPLVVLAALGCGLVWSFGASLLGRLPPIMISHAVFTYFAATMLLPRFA